MRLPAGAEESEVVLAASYASHCQREPLAVTMWLRAR